MVLMKGNKLLYAVVNPKGDGFYVYLVPKEKRKYNDLYLLRIRGSIKKNKLDLYMQEIEALDLARVLVSGVAHKRYLDKHNAKVK